ncbi:MAG TPA: hypothetical protein VEA15_10820 [Caulobacteraceae bacterium]|nr:hypothetical protein [Caulobacteraceae bacterium]
MKEHEIDDRGLNPDANEQGGPGAPGPLEGMCPECSGTGITAETGEPCPMCDGTGRADNYRVGGG